jgi:hypothetical protein
MSLTIADGLTVVYLDEMESPVKQLYLYHTVQYVLWDFQYAIFSSFWDALGVLGF